jgi:hypothetical protein
MDDPRDPPRGNMEDRMRAAVSKTAAPDPPNCHLGWFYKGLCALYQWDRCRCANAQPAPDAPSERFGNDTKDVTEENDSEAI